MEALDDYNYFVAPQAPILNHRQFSEYLLEPRVPSKVGTRSG